MRNINKEELKKEFEEILENKQLKIYLQPKFNTITEKIVGAEALVRISKNGKIIMPDRFVPIYEKTGIITKLDMYIFEQMCKKINEWESKNYKIVPISINESRKHLYNKNHINDLIDIVNKYNISTNMIELELTETTIVKNIEVAKAAEKRAHKLGFVVSMDDFGVGYSSFYMLKNINIDILKIDKRFSDEVIESTRGRIIMESIIDMSKKLNIQTVAEGVETRQQLEYLKSIGCNMVQGYYFDKPLLIEKFENKYLK